VSEKTADFADIISIIDKLKACQFLADGGSPAFINLQRSGFHIKYKPMPAAENKFTGFCRRFVGRPNF